MLMADFFSDRERRFWRRRLGRQELSELAAQAGNIVFYRLGTGPEGKRLRLGGEGRQFLGLGITWSRGFCIGLRRQSWSDLLMIFHSELDQGQGVLGLPQSLGGRRPQDVGGITDANFQGRGVFFLGMRQKLIEYGADSENSASVACVRNFGLEQPHFSQDSLSVVEYAAGLHQFRFDAGHG
jgi:hypothetical protein